MDCTAWMLEKLTSKVVPGLIILSEALDDECLSNFA